MCKCILIFFLMLKIFYLIIFYFCIIYFKKNKQQNETFSCLAVSQRKYLVALSSCVRWWWLVLLQPLRSATMDDLFSEPHQADECAQGAGDNKAALKTICKQVLSVEAQT